MMKVKSVSDVITNSSTEVWTIRTSLWEEAREALEERATRKKIFHEEVTENLYTLFTSYQTLEDLEKDPWKLKYILPHDLLPLLVPYHLPSSHKFLLKRWGHTEEEFQAHEEEVNQRRLRSLKDKEEEILGHLGWEVAVFGGHTDRWGNCQAGRDLLEFLKNHNPGGENWRYSF